MKLLTKEMEKRFAELGDQDIPDPIVVAKFFTPWTNWTWFAIAWHSEDRVFFGWCVGQEKELGYFSLDEMESVTGPAGLKIERDLGFKEQHLSEIKKKIRGVTARQDCDIP